MIESRVSGISGVSGLLGRWEKRDFGLGISEFGKDMVSCGNQSYVVGFADGRWLSIFDLFVPSPASPELPGMSLPFSSFSTCTIVHPPSRLEGSPPNFGGPVRGALLLTDRATCSAYFSSISLVCAGG